MIFHARHDQPRQARPAQPRPRHAVRPQHFYVFVCGRQWLQAADGRRQERVVGEVGEVLLLAWLALPGCLFGNVLTLIHGRIFMLHSLRDAAAVAIAAAACCSCHVAFIGPGSAKVFAK